VFPSIPKNVTLCHPLRFDLRNIHQQQSPIASFNDAVRSRFNMTKKMDNKTLVIGRKELRRVGEEEWQFRRLTKH
jgi:hypothetical protein